MRKLFLLIGAAVGVVVALALPRLLSPVGTIATAQAVETAQVERQALESSVESTGTITARETLYLSFSASGTVSEVGVEVGDSVTAGQVLARLNIADLEYQVALQEQSLIVQQTAYDELVAEPTAEEIAQAQANLASSQSQLESAQAALAAAPNETTINCSGLEDAQVQLDEAQDDYDDYVAEGYEWDANFMPDPDSTEGTALRDARSAYNVEAAQCANVTTVSEYEIQVAAAQASVDQSQAALDSLLNGPTAEDVASAEAQLQQARLELENARTGLDDAAITAPFDGVIASVDIVPGELVSSSTSAITLVDLSALYIDVSVDELDIAEVEVGQNALISPDALDDTTLDGQVARIAPVGTNEDGIVTFDVRINLSNIDGLPVRVGMTTDVEILVGSEAAALVVPTQAIQRSGESEFVQLYNDDGTTTDVPVTTGTTSDGMTVVQGDLTEGVRVVLPPDTQAQQGGSPFGG